MMGTACTTRPSLLRARFAGTGVTGPTGTGTSLGTQGTVAQGTDALWNLVGSVANAAIDGFEGEAADFLGKVGGVCLRQRTAERGAHQDDGTVLGELAYLVQHDSYHLGQVSLLRRQMGLPPMSLHIAPREPGRMGA